MTQPSSSRSLSILLELVMAAAVLASPSYARTATDCPNLPDGTACDDGDACTVGETCQGGSCLPPVSFAQPAGSPVAVGTTPYSVAVGDFNWDGILDLVVANYASDNITILLGNGAGGFAQAAGSPVAVGTGPISVAVGDWSGDGRLDVAVANYNSSDVTILVANGNGTFNQAAGSPLAVGSLPIAIAVTDLNGDDKLDLTVANLLSDNVSILLGNGSSGFSQAAGSPVAVGTQPIAIAIADANGDGRVDLAVANLTSNDVTILLGNGSGGFSQAGGSPIAVGTSPHSIVAADMSGDGKPDLAVVNTTSNDVTILLGNGTGGFGQATGSPVGVGSAPAMAVLGDLNGDDKIDLAVANYGSNDITVLLGNGAGGLQPVGSSPATQSSPNSLAIGDLNGDSKLDLAAPNAGSNNVTILLNSTTFAADGTACDDGDACTVGESCRSGNCLAPVSLTQPAGSPVAVVGNPFSVVARDLNGDGKLDLVASNNNTNTVTILLGNGSGGFSPAAGSPIAVGQGPYSVAVEELSGDGKLDLAVTNSDSNNVTILLGNGTGGFSEAAGSPVATGSRPVYIAAEDLDGDGKADLMVANHFANSVTILLGNGAGGFSQAAGSPVGTGSRPNYLAVGDLNGDGIVDLAVANELAYSIEILLGNGAGGFSYAPSSPVVTNMGPIESLAIGDINGDGRLDLATANVLTSNVTILLGNGSGGFSQPAGSPVAVGLRPYSLAIGDLNGDGKLDLAVGDAFNADVTILLGNGSGGFIQPPGSPIFANATHPIAIGDLNGDGRLDLAVALANGNSITILLNKTCPTGGCSALSLTQPSGSPVAVGNLPISVAVGDVNEDGKLDLAVANSNTTAVTILLGNGLGGVNPAAGSPVAVGTGPVAVASGDVSGDGDLDLVVANYFSNNITILLGNGSGGFSQAAGSPILVGSGSISIALGDVNGDGTLDVAVANYNHNNVTILLGNGSGGFSQAAGSPIAAGSGPRSAEFGDLNGDGKLDLALANDPTNNVRILLGNGAGGFSQAAGSPIVVGARPVSLAVNDVNGDGKLDLAVANFDSNSVTILLGNGSGGFSQAAGSPVAVGASPRSVAFGYLNGDGNIDLAVANSSSNSVTILIGSGSGGFSQPSGSPVNLAALSQPTSVAFGDMNGDGKADLAVTNYNHSNVAILLNHTIPAADGTACNDDNACTANDTCSGGLCSGAPFPVPAEVSNGVQVNKSGGNAVITWTLATGASSSSVLRGGVSALPVGPGGGEEVCLASTLSSSTLTWPDATPPATGAGFWYLVRGENACGNGPYGFQAINGLPTVPRVTTTCP